MLWSAQARCEWEFLFIIVNLNRCTHFSRKRGHKETRRLTEMQHYCARILSSTLPVDVLVKFVNCAAGTGGEFDFPGEFIQTTVIGTGELKQL